MKKGVIFLKNAIKLGFGLVFGMELAKIAVGVLNELIVKSAANSKKFMENTKETDPELHEDLKQYTNE